MSGQGFEQNSARAPRARYEVRQPSTTRPRRVPSPLGPEIRSIVCNDLDSESQHDPAQITECQYLASYNLMEGLSKTILVPGRPALWTPAVDAMKLPADSGNRYRDVHSATFPNHPFEPTVRSVIHLDPTFNSSNIDVVACGSTLGDLLRFAVGNGDGFSFTLDVVGQTIFFIRRSLSPTELIEDLVGFAGNFVTANTTWSPDAQGSSSHQRVVTYKLCGSRILVRFETDAYTMGQDEDFDSDGNASGSPVTCKTIDEDRKTVLRHQEEAGSTSQLTLRERGSRVTQSATIDIKTRSAQKQREEVMADLLPRLWLRQIENIVLSFHKNGLFKPAEVENIRFMISDWERKNQTAIVRLVKLIEEVKRVAMNAKGQKLEVRCDEACTLHFHELDEAEQGKWCAVPDSLRKSWIQRCQQ